MDFALNRDKYSVDIVARRLLKDGQPVSWG